MLPEGANLRQMLTIYHLICVWLKWTKLYNTSIKTTLEGQAWSIPHSEKTKEDFIYKTIINIEVFLIYT